MRWVRACTFAGVLLLALVAASCGRPAVPLTGTVADAYTGKPVVATLTIGDTRVTTDANGSYQIDRWSARDVIKVVASGYEPVEIDLSTLPNLQRPEPPVVTLEPLRVRPNTLSGVVTDLYTRAPVAGAIVQASEAISATTDATGRYTLSGVPETFRVTVAADGYAPLVSDLSRTTSFDAAIRPDTLRGTVTDRYTGRPIAGASVSLGDLQTTTDSNGQYLLRGIPEKGTITISARGYASLDQPVERTTTLDLALRPDTLSGVLIDAKSKQPIRNATIIATLNLQSSDVAMVRIDNSPDGSFTLEGVPEQGYLQVLAPGYRKAVIELRSGSVPETIELEPFYSKALYVTAAVASRWNLLMKYFDIIDATELNAIVIDIKSDLRDDLGLVYYDSQVPIVRELGTFKPYMDLRKILDEAKRRGIYTIARVHMFSHDNVLAEAKPEWAAKDRTTGGIFYDYPAPGIRYAWLDPWNENVWDYNIQLSVEAALLGFDEIQYDYIRFPSLEFSPTDKDRLLLSREGTTEERWANITEVLKRSHRAINGAGAFFSVDVFGYTSFRPSQTLGQNLSMMAEYTDYISPMIYPSHFSPGEFGFDNPAKYPYEVIQKAMAGALKQVDGKRALLRPWLQDFTLIWVPKELLVEYTPAEVRAQIRAVEEFDASAGWILYDSTNVYHVEALKPAE
ncbi:MAG: putative glycoside hydrolase [Roseiflexaceae bacterium]|nr:carboxypeptidase regulatory-like domain-containing protein [Roseiflexus sp.]MDW8212034.1 putative glycoside hydrolase [Roseiflexaceae bacterium]